MTTRQKLYPWWTFSAKSNTVYCCKQMLWLWIWVPIVYFCCSNQFPCSLHLTEWRMGWNIGGDPFFGTVNNTEKINLLDFCWDCNIWKLTLIVIPILSGHYIILKLMLKLNIFYTCNGAMHSMICFSLMHACMGSGWLTAFKYSSIKTTLSSCSIILNRKHEGSNSPPPIIPYTPSYLTNFTTFFCKFHSKLHIFSDTRQTLFWPYILYFDSIKKVIEIQ